MAQYVGVSLVFFLSGLSLRTTELLTAAKQWKVHLETQFLSLIVCPVFFYIVVRILITAGVFTQSNPLAQGLIILGCLPTTISSAAVRVVSDQIGVCVKRNRLKIPFGNFQLISLHTKTNLIFFKLLTKSAGGNQPAALFNAALGNIIGLCITPLTLLVLLGTSAFGTDTIGGALANLAETVIGPLFIGQVVQYFLPTITTKFLKKVNVSKVNNVIILLIIYSTFCDTFTTDGLQSISSTSLAIVLTVTVLTHAAFLLLTFLVGKLPIPGFRFSKEDRIAILLCATQKTAGLGVPLISIKVVFRSAKSN